MFFWTQRTQFWQSCPKICEKKRKVFRAMSENEKKVSFKKIDSPKNVPMDTYKAVSLNPPDFLNKKTKCRHPISIESKKVFFERTQLLENVLLQTQNVILTNPLKSFETSQFKVWILCSKCSQVHVKCDDDNFVELFSSKKRKLFPNIQKNERNFFFEKNHLP